MNLEDSKTKVFVIGRVRTQSIKNAIFEAYDEVIYKSSLEINSIDLKKYCGFDLIIATNPYKKKYSINNIIKKIENENFKNIFYLNTFVSNVNDRYQYLKQYEGSILKKSLNIISLNIPFIFTCEYDKTMLRGNIAGGFTAPYIYYSDITNSLKKKQMIENNIKFLDSYRSSLDCKYLSIVRNILWKNSYVKNKYINLIFKVIERIVLKIYGVGISLCYLKEKVKNDN